MVHPLPSLPLKFSAKTDLAYKAKQRKAKQSKANQSKAKHSININTVYAFEFKSNNSNFLNEHNLYVKKLLHTKSNLET